MDLIQWESDHGTKQVHDYGFFVRPLATPTLFHFKTRRMEVNPHGGAWSLKFTLTGRETYSLGRRRLALLPGEMLLVERGRTYGSEISERTESLSLFFPDAWIGETLSSLAHGDDCLLERRDSVPRAALPAVPLRLSATGAPTLANLIDGVKARNSNFVEENALELVVEALDQASAMKRLHGRLKEKRATTRDEILTRLSRAHDRIVDQQGLGLNLDRLSETACLSRFHFLRLFKQVYGLTPLRFAARVRMRRAVALSRAGDLSGAMRAGGFESIAAFNRAVRSDSAGTRCRVQAMYPQCPTKTQSLSP